MDLKHGKCILALYISVSPSISFPFSGFNASGQGLSATQLQKYNQKEKLMWLDPQFKRIGNSEDQAGLLTKVRAFDHYNSAFFPQPSTCPWRISWDNWIAWIWVQFSSTQIIFISSQDQVLKAP